VTIFKENERVEILSGFQSLSVWSKDMDDCIGQVCIVSTGEIGKCSYGTECVKVFNLAKNNSWWFPVESLKSLEFPDWQPTESFTITEPLQPWEKF
jgi:hypothetical protein